MPKWRSVKIHIVMEEDYEESTPVAAFRNKRRAEQDAEQRTILKIGRLQREGNLFPGRPTGHHTIEIDLLEEHFI